MRTVTQRLSQGLSGLTAPPGLSTVAPSKHRIGLVNPELFAKPAPAMTSALALGPRRFGVLAACVVAGAAFAAAALQLQRPEAQPVADLEPTLPEGALAVTVAAAPAHAPYEALEVTINRNDTLDGIFRQLQLKLADLATLRSVPEVRKSLDMIRPGDVIRMTHLGGEIKSLTRQLDETSTLSVTRNEQGFNSNIIENPLEIEARLLTGTVSSSLFNAVNSAGGTDRLAVTLAEVFQYDIDFVNLVQPGDGFVVSYEQQWQDGEFVRDGAILAAEFTNGGKTYRAVRYTVPGGRTEYYTPDGRPVRKAFLRFPVDFARVSSGFNPSRRHPILKTVRPHRGVDFGAPTGTPIKAAGNGRVVTKGIQGAYGNTVVLTHGKGVTTLYAHMSRFRKGLRIGEHVGQGDVIGYIGMTGLATGPHLHYEYRVNGVHKNPAKITLPKADPIPDSLQADFKLKTAPLLAALDGAAPAETRLAQMTAP